MKTLKFRETLSKLILAGKKTATWRLFDDKIITFQLLNSRSIYCPFHSAPTCPTGYYYFEFPVGQVVLALAVARSLIADFT